MAKQRNAVKGSQYRNDKQEMLCLLQKQFFQSQTPKPSENLSVYSKSNRSFSSCGFHRQQTSFFEEPDYLW